MIVNVFASKVRALKHVKQNLRELKGEIDKPIVRVEF